MGPAHGRHPRAPSIAGDDAAIQRAVAQAHALGARISINHPFADCKACG
jgi:hypothetical protein